MLLINKKGCEVLKRPESQILGQSWFDVFTREADEKTLRSILDDLLHQTSQTAEVAYESYFLTPQHEERVISWNSAVLDDTDEDRRLIISSGKDITQEKLLQQRKDTFVATLTHDLNTPIRAEHQVLQLLFEENFGPLSPEQKEVVQEIMNSNRFMQQMVDNLLTIYKFEDEQIELTFEAADLNMIIQTLLSSSLGEMAQNKHQTITLDLSSNLPPLCFDKNQIQQVLLTLIHNAIFFSPEQAHITITTQKQDETALVSVKDTGPGIEPEIVKNLFNRYNAVSKKFRQVGTGLSLYLAHQIIEAHKGEIGVQSVLGQGSTFFFRIPTTLNSSKPLSQV